jgi:hypothetical protein
LYVNLTNYCWGHEHGRQPRIAALGALVSERDKLRPPAEQAETVARFDKMATDPQFQRRDIHE